MKMPLILLFGISGGEILVLLLIVLLLFGPKKIPEIARMVGRGMNEVRKVQREINSEISRYSDDIDSDIRKMDPGSAKKAAVAKGKSQTGGVDGKEEKTVKPPDSSAAAKEKSVGPYGRPVPKDEGTDIPEPDEDDAIEKDGREGPASDDLPYPYGKGDKKDDS